MHQLTKQTPQKGKQLPWWSKYPFATIVPSKDVIGMEKLITNSTTVHVVHEITPVVGAAKRSWGCTRDAHCHKQQDFYKNLAPRLSSYLCIGHLDVELETPLASRTTYVVMTKLCVEYQHSPNHWSRPASHTHTIIIVITMDHHRQHLIRPWQYRPPIICW